MQSGDHLIVSELSRIGRSVVNVVTIVNKLIALGVNIHILKEQLFIKPNVQNPFTDFQINIFSAFAQLERDFISKRTKEVLQARKAKGVKLGKPKGTIQSLSEYVKNKLNKED